jgi:hypothetical protein
MKLISDPNQIDELIKALQDQVTPKATKQSLPQLRLEIGTQPKPESPPLPQGSVYVYQIPGIAVTLVSSPAHVLSKATWVVVKVGISKPNKLAKRLTGEGRMWRDGTKLQVFIPGHNETFFVKGNRNDLVPVTKNQAERWSNIQLTEYVRANYITFKDVICIQPADIGKEDLISSYPTGIGINIAKESDLVTEVPETFKFKKGNIQKKALALFFRNEAIVPDKQSPSTGFGETEFVIMPENLITYLVDQWKDRIDIMTVLDIFKNAYDGLNLKQITLTNNKHPTHQSLVFKVREGGNWPI